VGMLCKLMCVHLRDNSPASVLRRCFQSWARCAKAVWCSAVGVAMSGVYSACESEGLHGGGVGAMGHMWCKLLCTHVLANSPSSVLRRRFHVCARCARAVQC
jgi:hypothetical protein